MLLEDIVNIIEDLNQKDLNNMLKNCQAKIKSVEGKSVPIKEIRFKDMGDPDNMEFCPSNMYKDDDDKFVIQLDKDIKDKSTAERLIYHEIIHAYKYDDNNYPHGPKYSSMAKRLNNKLFAGGEYIPIHGENRKWQNWAEKRNPEYGVRAANEREIEEYAEAATNWMKNKNWDKKWRGKVRKEIMDYVNKYHTVKPLKKRKIENVVTDFLNK